MDIQIFTDIDDPFLQSEWVRLQREGDIFPQSSYHWCATWWKHLRGRRTLHIVMVVDGQGRALAIAPLCIERHFGVKVLRSFPVHFGDYYTFINGSDPVATKAAYDSILEYIARSRNWAWVRLEQVVESDVLAQTLREGGYCGKRMTSSVIANFLGLSWEEYLGKLHRRFRKNLRNRMRKIDTNFKVTLKIVTKWDSYEREYDAMRTMHEQRWHDDNAPPKSVAENGCWREAIRGQFAAGEMVYFLLLFNGEQVAYRMGFIHHGTYFAWHTGFNPKYRDYYPGVMIMAYMIQEFLKNGIASVNFMAGEYDWKLDWSPERTVISHYMFSSPSTSARAALLNFYHHRVRDRMKASYHLMMEKRLLRALSRQVITLRQKMAGQR